MPAERYSFERRKDQPGREASLQEVTRDVGCSSKVSGRISEGSSWVTAICSLLKTITAVKNGHN